MPVGGAESSFSPFLLPFSVLFLFCFLYHAHNITIELIIYSVRYIHCSHPRRPHSLQRDFVHTVHTRPSINLPGQIPSLKALLYAPSSKIIGAVSRGVEGRKEDLMLEVTIFVLMTVIKQLVFIFGN